jgi:hypothetical protein
MERLSPIYRVGDQRNPANAGIRKSMPGNETLMKNNILKCYSLVLTKFTTLILFAVFFILGGSNCISQTWFGDKIPVVRLDENLHIYQASSVMPDLQAYRFQEDGGFTVRNYFASRIAGKLDKTTMIRFVEFSRPLAVGDCAADRIPLVFESKEDDLVINGITVDGKLTNIGFEKDLTNRWFLTGAKNKFYCSGQIVAANATNSWDEEPLFVYSKTQWEQLLKFVGPLPNPTKSALSWTSIDKKTHEATLLNNNGQKQTFHLVNVYAMPGTRNGWALVLLPPITEEMNNTNAINAEHNNQTMPTDFLGKWIAVDNKDHYIIVSTDEIRWERGDIEGPEVVPTSKWTVLPDKHSVSFPARSSAGALVAGKIVRGSMTVEMTATGDGLTISEGNSDTIKDPASGFSFQQTRGAKYVFRKAESK